MNDDETISKDRFFQQLAQLSDEMSAAHGKDFAMGALVLAARFIAEAEARRRAANGAASDANVEPARRLEEKAGMTP